MKARDLIVETFFLVTVFALFGISLLSLLDYAVRSGYSQLSVAVLPDSAVIGLLLSGLVLSATRQARLFTLLFAAPLTAICLYILMHNELAGGAEMGPSWVSGLIRMRSELAFVGLSVTLGTALTLFGSLARRLALGVGSAIVLLGFLSQLADFYPFVEGFRLGFKHSANIIANLFSMALGVSVILLALLGERKKREGFFAFPTAGFMAVLVACVSWYLLSLQNSHSVERESNLLLAKTKASIVHTQADRLALLHRVSDRWISQGKLPLARLWQQEVRGYLRDFPGLDLIAILDEDFSPLLQESYDSAQFGALSQFLSNRNNRIWLESVVEHALESGAGHISKIQLQGDGVATAMIAKRLAMPGRKPLVLMASFNIQETMRYLGDQESSGLSLRLYEEGSEVYSSVSEKPDQLSIDVGTIDIPMQDDMKWRLVSTLGRAHTGDLLSYVPSLALLLGLFLSGLLMLSRRLLHLNAERTRNIESLNIELEATLAKQQSLQALNHRIVQFSRDVVCAVDRQGRFIEISPSCEQMFGYTAEQMIGRLHTDLVVPEDLKSTEENFAAVLAGQLVYDFRNRYRHRDGSIINLLWAAHGSAKDGNIVGVAQDITPLSRTQAYAETQRDILSMIARDHYQPDILEAICLMVESMEPEVSCSILLLDAAGKHLHTAAAPRLTDNFTQAIDGVEISDKSGSCGTAAYRHQMVIVEDIATDPLWADYRDLALAENLRACWSFPMLTPDNKVLGTFAIYSKQPSTPSQVQIDYLATAAQLATIAIMRCLDRQTLKTSEQRFRSLFTFNPDSVYSFDLAGHFQQVNDATLSLTQLSEEQIINRHFSELILPADLERTQEYFTAACLGEPQRYESCIVDGRGELLYLDISNLPIIVDGQITGVFGIAKDITESKNSVKQLRLFKQSVESSYNGIVIVDALVEGQPITYVNAGFERITGYSSDEVVGRNCRFLQGSEVVQPGLKIVRDGLAKNTEIHSVIRNFRKDGSPFWNDLYISPLLDDEGLITHYVGVQNDISEERRFQDELSFNASHDALTGLPNRTLLQDRLNQSWQLARRHKRCIAVMFIDLDGFKQINDANGHHLGDLVLMDVADRLLEQVRAGDTVARIGGDEFVVLLPDVTEEKDVIVFVERILAAISKPYLVEGATFHSSASIGITLGDGSVEEPMELIQQADMAMYKAKQEGRNNYQWFTNDLSQHARGRADLRGELQHAIENENFMLYYQPQVESSSGLVVGMEALIRWKHSTRGFIAPMEFISLAEESGQIIPISLWVLDTACRHIRLLSDQGISTLSVAVNISPIHFRRNDFLESITDALDRYDLKPEQLELEITESVLLNHTESTIETLQELRVLGIGVALDDFGTGYSSLSYLKRLPISKVKIDRCFITDIISDSNDAAITQGIISMAHHLSLKVVAEGVEDKSQDAFLREANCDQLQGYYLARPMPFEELQLFLQKNTVM